MLKHLRPLDCLWILVVGAFVILGWRGTRDIGDSLDRIEKRQIANTNVLIPAVRMTRALAQANGIDSSLIALPDSLLAEEPGGE